jgi:hypothetical protein
MAQRHSASPIATFMCRWNPAVALIHPITILLCCMQLKKRFCIRLRFLVFFSPTHKKRREHSRERT